MRRPTHIKYNGICRNIKEMLIKNTTRNGNKICVSDTHSLFYNFFLKKRYLCSSKYIYFIHNFFLIGNFGDWKIYVLVYKPNTTFKI